MDSETPIHGTAWPVNGTARPNYDRPTDTTARPGYDGCGDSTAQPGYDRPEDTTANVEVKVTGLYPAYRTCPVCRGVFPDDDAWHEVILDGRVVKICARCYDRLTMLIEG